MLKINKKIIIIASIILLSVFVVIAIVAGWLYLKKAHFVPEQKIIKQETQEELLERLTPTDVKVLTEKEKKEQEELLERLTPDKPKPMTEQERRETEELLKRLTP